MWVSTATVTPPPTARRSEPAAAYAHFSWTHVLASHYYSRYFSVDTKGIGDHTRKVLARCFWGEVHRRPMDSLFLVLGMNYSRLRKGILTRVMTWWGIVRGRRW